MFDTRFLFADTATDPETIEAQRKKPAVPLHVIATGQQPMLRFISPLATERAEPALQQWAKKVSEWIAEGKQPYLFFHTPNNDGSPQLAARFAQILAPLVDAYQTPPAWPTVARQEDLF